MAKKKSKLSKKKLLIGAGVTLLGGCVACKIMRKREGFEVVKSEEDQEAPVSTAEVEQAASSVSVLATDPNLRSYEGVYDISDELALSRQGLHEVHMAPVKFKWDEDEDLYRINWASTGKGKHVDVASIFVPNQVLTSSRAKRFLSGWNMVGRWIVEGYLYDKNKKFVKKIAISHKGIANEDAGIQDSGPLYLLPGTYYLRLRSIREGGFYKGTSKKMIFKQWKMTASGPKSTETAGKNFMALFSGDYGKATIIPIIVGSAGNTIKFKVKESSKTQVYKVRKDWFIYLPNKSYERLVDEWVTEGAKWVLDKWKKGINANFVSG